MVSYSVSGGVFTSRLPLVGFVVGVFFFFRHLEII